MSELITALYGLKESAAHAWKQALDKDLSALGELEASMNKTQRIIAAESLDTERPTPDKSWIMTFSGRRFNPFEPELEAISILDIAHALSHVARFTGHTSHHYSVAQHSVLVSRMCDPKDALAGLLHDGSEAYLNDLARPVKRHPGMEVYREAEARLQALIFERFGLPAEMPASVKEADNQLCIIEGRSLNPFLDEYWSHVDVSGVNIVPTTPETSRAMFLHRFQELTK